MQNNSILILGRHNGMMQNVIAFLHQHGYTNTKGVLTNEDVTRELLSNAFKILIVGGGVDNGTRQMIKQLIAENNISIKVVEHFGNPASLIDEIKNS